MFLILNYRKLAVYEASRNFVPECYQVSRSLLPDEKFGMVSPIRKAALPEHWNSSGGSSEGSEAGRKRYREIAGASLIEIDAALETAEGT